MQELYKSRIKENLQSVQTQIAEAAQQAGRNPEEITLVAVSKTFPAQAARAAVEAGAVVLGESRVQEGAKKIDELGRIAAWHLIGHLQSNKAKKAIEYFDLIQSLDSVELAEKVAEEAVKAGKTMDCLIEVNSSGEGSKFGFSPQEILISAARIAELQGIRLSGLMTIGPWTTNEGCIRKAFDMTYQLYQTMHRELGEQFSVLSMGMSSDFEMAIASGSTMVRVGTAIFGDRTKT
ncbi:MAG: YggS family pyridoxal phosphate-dependent enzyme [Candidatus Zixiibacteriota bacterium]